MEKRNVKKGIDASWQEILNIWETTSINLLFLPALELMAKESATTRQLKQLLTEDKHNMLEMLDRVMFYEGKCTRIDMAMDDRTGSIIPFEKIKEAVQTGHVSSRWKTSTEYVKRRLQDGEVIGHTINIGSRKSKMYMRIYDKAMEQGIDTPWYRIEMEIRDERAEVLQNILLFENQIGQVYAKIINNYIRFLEPGSDSNRGRWPTAPWWSSMISEVEKVSLTRKPEEKTIEKVRSWVKQQVGPSLALLVMADEGAVDDIMKIIIEGRSRLKEKHMRMLAVKKKAKIEQTYQCYSSEH